jgi:hypothetical protein
MAVFRPDENINVCKLNFDDKFFYEISLDEETNLEIAKIGEKQVEILTALSPDDKEALNKAYNSTLDAIDAILGEGAGADIMSLYKKPGILQTGAVISYITSEYVAAYNALIEKYKSTATVPNEHPAIKRGRK